MNGNPCDEWINKYRPTAKAERNKGFTSIIPPGIKIMMSLLVRAVIAYRHNMGQPGVLR